MIKLTIAEKALKKRIFHSVKETIDQYSRQMTKKIEKKTILYSLWSFAGLFLILVDFPKIAFYILSFFMILFVLYIAIDFIQSLIKTLKFINHFDENMEKLVEKKIENVKDQSIKNKIFLWVSGQNNKDIEDFYISYFVREMARQFIKYKKSLVVRMITFTVVVFLFREILFRILY